MRANFRVITALSWALTACALGFAYFSYQTSQLREAELQLALSESQQLVLQVSNRLAATEAQLNTLKISLAEEEQEKARLLAEINTANEKRRPAPSSATVNKEPAYKPEPAQKPAQQHSLGQGVSSFFKRIRQGFKGDEKNK